MADIVERVVFEGDSSGAEAASDRVGKAGQQAFESIGSQITKSIVAANLYQKALGFLFEEFKKGLESVKEFEKTSIQLSTALQAQGRDVQASVAFLNAQSNAMEDLTTISDETIRSLQAQAVNYGIATDRVDDYIRAAIGLANATGEDVNTAFTDLIRLQETGNTRNIALKTSVKDLTDEQIALGDAVDLVNLKFGDFVDLKAQGTFGAINQLTTAWGNFTEELIKSITQWDVFKTVINTVTQSIQGLLQIGPALYGLLNPNEIQASATAVAKAPVAQAGFDFGSTGGKGLFAMDVAKKDKKEKGSIDFGDFGAGAVESENDKMLSLQEKYQDKSNDLLDRWLEHQSDQRLATSKYIIGLEEEQAAEHLKIQTEMVNTSMNIAQALAETTADAMIAMLEGENVSFQAIADAFLKQTGRQLIGMGIKHSLEAAGMAILSVGTNPQAYALASLAAMEVAAGGAMIAGSLMIPNQSGMGGGGREEGGGKSSDFSGGGGGSRAGGGGSRNSNETVVINVNGVLTSEKAGKEILEAIGKYNRKFL